MDVNVVGAAGCRTVEIGSGLQRQQFQTLLERRPLDFAGDLVARRTNAICRLDQDVAALTDQLDRLLKDGDISGRIAHSKKI